MSEDVGFDDLIETMSLDTCRDYSLFGNCTYFSISFINL